jgi:hypothetical protein
MAFNPTAQDYKDFEWLKNFGKAPDGRGFQLTPAGYSVRTNFWSNVYESRKLQARSKAVGGASSWDELIYKEKIQSPQYIAEQAKIKADKIQAALDREEAIYQAGIDEGERLLEIQLEKKRLQDEIKREEIVITPEIISTVVSTSSLIPLGIIAILLINSRNDNK